MKRRTTAGAALGLSTAVVLAGCSSNTAPQPPKAPNVCITTTEQAPVKSAAELNTFLSGVGSCILKLSELQGTNTAKSPGYEVATMLQKPEPETVTMTDYPPTSLVLANWTIVVESTQTYTDPDAITAALSSTTKLWHGTLQTNNLQNTDTLTGFNEPTENATAAEKEDAADQHADWTTLQNTTDGILKPAVTAAMQGIASTSTSAVPNS